MWFETAGLEGIHPQFGFAIRGSSAIRQLLVVKD
jgi:hypothetical protein